LPFKISDDPAYFPELDKGRTDRQKAIDELITLLMKALGPDRGRCEAIYHNTIFAAFYSC
jgi:hypothetical protein